MVEFSKFLRSLDEHEDFPRRPETVLARLRNIIINWDSSYLGNPDHTTGVVGRRDSDEGHTFGQPH